MSLIAAAATTTIPRMPSVSIFIQKIWT
jgi:hypothetical protein